MPALDKRISTRLTELVNQGAAILNFHSTHLALSDELRASYERAVRSWGTSVLNLLERVFGKESIHFQEFQAQYAQYRNYFDSYRINHAQGILLAAQTDYSTEALFDTRQLIRAEVFGDFLDQVALLLDAGYMGPAAVLAGAVIEDALRKLSAQNNVALPAKPKLDTMNAALTKAGVYNVLAQKQITWIADLRNKAAHGKWNEFTLTDVQMMVEHVRGFMAKHF